MNASGPWRLGEVHHQLGLRRYNEELETLISSKEAELSSYVCECSDAECTSPIILTHREYARVRADGARFAIARHHEDPEIDLLVDEGPRYATIQKVPGRASRMAVETDPRSLRVKP